MDEADIRTDERKRVADALTRYFVEGAGTFRVLINYLGLDYHQGEEEGWFNFNNAVADHDAKVATGERPI